MSKTSKLFRRNIIYIFKFLGYETVHSDSGSRFDGTRYLCRTGRCFGTEAVRFIRNKVRLILFPLFFWQFDAFVILLRRKQQILFIREFFLPFLQLRQRQPFFL